MKEKKLFLVCDNYPHGAGEFFIDDEMKVLHPYFDKIYVVSVTNNKKQAVYLNRYTPHNLVDASFAFEATFLSKLKGLKAIFTTFFWTELGQILVKQNIVNWFICFRIMYMDIVRANILKKQIEKTIIDNGLNVVDTVFYSYWHDYKALALALLSSKYKNMFCVSRAHGWDNFAEIHNPGYLPFKNFLFKMLSFTLPISQAGKIYFERHYNLSADNNIKVLKLGKFNSRKPNFIKENDEFLICSCSNLIPVKRVKLLVDILSFVAQKNVRWVHFGDGYLRKEIEEYALAKLSKVNVEFKGIVANDKILDYYANNYVDLFINVSASEGIPVSIMEAMSAAIPVVATDVGGTSEIVNGENGFLIHKDLDVKSVAILIDEYFQSEKGQILQRRRNAYNYWMQNYEAGKNYSEFAKLLLHNINNCSN